MIGKFILYVIGVLACMYLLLILVGIDSYFNDAILTTIGITQAVIIALLLMILTKKISIIPVCRQNERYEENMFHPLRAIPAEHKLNAYVRRGPSQ